MRKVKVFSQHGDDTGDLLLDMEQRHLAVDSSHDMHQLQLSTVTLQHVTQRLYEPGTGGRVPP